MMKNKGVVERLLSIVLTISLGLASAVSQAAVLKEGHPDSYRVQKGDSLWRIAEKFFQDPWDWQTIWNLNHTDAKHIRLYPGDEVMLEQNKGGEPYLSVQRSKHFANHQNLPITKLSPRVRTEALSGQIPVIPMDIINQFLVKVEVATFEEITAAPYILSVGHERMAVATNEKIYVRGLEEATKDGLTIYRAGDTYIDPDTNEVLGIEAIYLGNAKMLKHGDPSTLLLTSVAQEVQINDVILAEHTQDVFSFTPHVPEEPIEAKIMSVYGGVSQIGQYDVVALNQGTVDGVEVGHVMTVFEAGQVIADRESVLKRAREYVKLPDEHAGTLMIFRAFDDLSFGLVLSATRALHVHDRVATP